MKKTWNEIKVWLDGYLQGQYGDEEMVDPWKNEMIETETVTSIWTDLAAFLGVPYTAQLTVNNTEDRYEDMRSKFVLFDQNDMPFFAIAFQKVVGVIGGRYAGLKEEGVKQMVEAAYTHLEQKPLWAVVTVEGGVADVDICPEGVEVVIIDYDGIEENIADNLRDVKRWFTDDDFYALAKASVEPAVQLMRSGRASGLIEACQMLDLEAIAEEAGIQRLTASQVGLLHNYA